MDTNDTKKKLGKKSKIIIALGILLTVAFLFWFVVFLIVAFIIELGFYPYSIDAKTLEVTFDFDETSFTVMLVLSVIFLICALLSFAFLALKYCKLKWRIICTASLLVFFLIGAFVFGYCWIRNIDAEIDRGINYYEKLKIHKYTEITIEDLLDDVNRFPKKYEGKTVTLEGWACRCEENTFILRFPEYHYTEIPIQYYWDDSTPRVVDGDYVVVTGKVEVYYSKSSGKYEAYLVSAICDIKNP